jgi:WRKY transcription factor 33
MTSSTGSLEHGGGFTFTPPPFITSFTDLLSGAGDMLAGAGDDRSPQGLFPRAGVPKFKSAQPPSLPILPPTMSPSSYFAIPAGLSPAELLDSPLLFTSASNILASPTTGAIPAQRFDWKEAADMIAASQQESRADFSFHNEDAGSDAVPATRNNTSFPSFNKVINSVFMINQLSSKY